MLEQVWMWDELFAEPSPAIGFSPDDDIVAVGKAVRFGGFKGDGKTFESLFNAVPRNTSHKECGPNSPHPSRRPMLEVDLGQTRCLGTSELD